MAFKFPFPRIQDLVPRSAAQQVERNFAELERTLAGGTGGATPVGGIIMWHGASADIPSGWAVCDGTLGTPDLRDRFVVGAGSTYALDATGGSANAVVVTHNHGNTNTEDSFHTHQQNTGANLTNFLPQAGTGVGGQTNFSTTGPNNSLHVHGTNDAGVSGTNANLPPYYGLFFIKRIA